MQDFQFFSPRSLEDALRFLSERAGRCKIIAGGTDLMPALRNEEVRPDYVLSILEIDRLRGITETEDSIRIDPTTTFTQITESEILIRHLPLLVEAAAWVGGPQIRNRGTIGGNIATGSPAADVLPAVIALEGELELQSENKGTRILPVGEAIASPYCNRFKPDELLTGIIIRKLPDAARSAFEKLGRRNALARARMNMSVVLCPDSAGVASELRIVPGAIMPVAKRMTNVEDMLLGKRPGSALLDAAGKALAEEMVKVTGVRWSTEYKVPVVQNVFRRVMGRLL